MNLLGPFRLTKALLGALAASARVGSGAVVINISSDAAVSPYAGWGAYGASKAALRHLTAIWAEEAKADGVSFLSIDPGDMDTPLHALAVPDADPRTLKRPAGLPRRKSSRRCSLRCRATPIESPNIHDCRRAAPTDGPPNSSSSTPMEAYDTCRAGKSGRYSTRATWLSQMMRQRCPRACDGTHSASGEPIEVRLAGWVSVMIRPNLSRSRSAPVTFARAPKIECLPRLSHQAIASLSDRWSRSLSGCLDHPRLFRLRFLGDRATILLRAGPSRASDSICACSRATGIVGRLDQNCRRPDCLRAAFSRICARLAYSVGLAANVGLVSPHLPTLPAFPRPEIRRSTDGSLSTNPISSGTNGDLDQGRCNRRVDASSPSERPWSARWSWRQTPTAASAPGDGVASGRIIRRTRLQVVDTILTGVHEPGESHFQLLARLRR